MGMIAGVPAIFGAWVGGFVYSPLAAVIFLAIGAGAIFQVIVTIMRWIQNEEGKLSKQFSTSWYCYRNDNHVHYKYSSLKSA